MTPFDIDWTPQADAVLNAGPEFHDDWSERDYARAQVLATALVADRLGALTEAVKRQTDQLTMAIGHLR